MSIRLGCLMATLFVFACGSANATVISTHTDRAAWEAALSGNVFLEETFAGDASSFTADSSANLVGSVTVDLLGGGVDPGPTGLNGSGFFQSEVDSDGADALGIDFGFSPAIGFGLLGLQNDSLTTPAGLNLVEIGLIVDGSSYLISDLLGLTDSSTATGNLGNLPGDAAIPFIGFILDASIESFSIVHADLLYADGVSGNSEEFFLDGLVLAQATVPESSIPEPATFLLFGFGLAGLAMVRRKSLHSD